MVSCFPDNNVYYIVDLVIIACLNFHEFLILRLFTRLGIRKLSFFLCRTIIKIIFVRLLSSRICLSREIREK